jgi:AraC family transcriptional regulator of adaptative response / DNA-3-methyladenine glycosylase II
MILMLAAALPAVWAFPADAALRTTYRFSYAIGEWMMAIPDLTGGSTPALALASILGTFLLVWLAQRLVESFGAPIETPFAGVTHLFPDAPRLADCAPAELARLGIIAARARAIVLLAREVAAGRIVLAPHVDIERTLAQLRALPGIGEWTAQAIAMRSLHWPDAFPAGDAGVAKALKQRRSARLADIAEHWRPWRAYAVMHLWAALEDT